METSTEKPQVDTETSPVSRTALLSKDMKDAQVVEQKLFRKQKQWSSGEPARTAKTTIWFPTRVYCAWIVENLDISVLNAETPRQTFYTEDVWAIGPTRTSISAAHIRSTFAQRFFYRIIDAMCNRIQA